MILKTIRDMSQEKQSDVSATCVWVLLKLSKRRHFHWLKRTTDHKKAHFSESAALFAEILEKARLLLLKTTYLNLLQRYFNFRSTHSVQVSHHSDSESWWKHSDMLAILIWQFFDDKKKGWKKLKPCCRQSSWPASILHLHIQNLPCDKEQRPVSRLWSEWPTDSR